MEIDKLTYLLINFVHGVKIVHIFEVDVNLDDVFPV